MCDLSKLCILAISLRNEKGEVFTVGNLFNFLLAKSSIKETIFFFVYFFGFIIIDLFQNEKTFTWTSSMQIRSRDHEC
ncbi:unnamed protein product [Rhizophagus irregularis]|nr:unnamed protein product [Rhizophagus irregularis]